jgi:MFS family permease
MSATLTPTTRRLVLVVGAVVFVDTMFYAAIAPLLPELAHSFHLSKTSAGVMTASYAAGTLIGSVPGGVLAVRGGPKATVWTGLALLACSTLAFGVLNTAPLLDLARFVEGVGGACSWAGGLAWLIAESPAGSRGALIGGTIGAAIAGSLFGPVIGTAADAVGRAPAFSGVVVLVLGLIAASAPLRAPRPQTGQGVRQLTRALANRRVQVGMWLVTLPAVASGLINVLGPLRLHRLGAGALAIGATFLLATAAEAVISPVIGRVSDRLGRLVPLRFGLAAAAALLACFTLPQGGFGSAAMVVAVTCALASFWAPAMAMLSDTAESRGLEQGLAAALMNLAWAGGQIIGSGGGGALAKDGGDRLATVLAAALCALTLVAVMRRRRRTYAGA